MQRAFCIGEIKEPVWDDFICLASRFHLQEGTNLHFGKELSVKAAVSAGWIYK